MRLNKGWFFMGMTVGFLGGRIRISRADGKDHAFSTEQAS
jgi:hypothetical protein